MRAEGFTWGGLLLPSGSYPRAWTTQLRQQSPGGRDTTQWMLLPHIRAACRWDHLARLESTRTSACVALPQIFLPWASGWLSAMESGTQEGHCPAQSPTPHSHLDAATVFSFGTDLKKCIFHLVPMPPYLGLEDSCDYSWLIIQHPVPHTDASNCTCPFLVSLLLKLSPMKAEIGSYSSLQD